MLTLITHTTDAYEAPRTKKRQQRGRRRHPDLTGRRVLVEGAYFGNPHDDPYPGLVYKWTSYRNVNLEKLWGYDIHYDDGDAYYMLEDDVVHYLLPETESALGIHEYPRMINNTWYPLTHTHTQIRRCCRRTRHG